MLAAHIAEESDSKMEQMEAVMAKEEVEIRKDLDGLGAFFAKRGGSSDVAAAKERFDRYETIKARILSLSRENTNVRSLELSLNQKRKALALCLDALSSLKEAVLEEPLASVHRERPEVRK
jgi:hypothetical protein